MGYTCTIRLFDFLIHFTIQSELIMFVYLILDMYMPRITMLYGLRLIKILID